MGTPADQIRSLLLPNAGHNYTNSLKASLERAGITCLSCDAVWGFELSENLSLVLDQQPDLIHLQWPEALCGVMEEGDLAARIGRATNAIHEISSRGIPIVWTMHNLRPHRTIDRDLESELYQCFASHASGVIHHSHAGERAATSTLAYPEDARHRVIRHGYFDTGPACPESTESAREKLGLPRDATVYVFCGAFRHDKRIDSLVTALGTDDRDASHHLVMVGDELDRARELHPGVRLDYRNATWAGHLTFDDLSLVVLAADGFVSAHGDEHLTSAGPHLSQSYRTSQVCLDSAYNREVLGDCAFYFDREPDPVENLRARIQTVTREMLRDAGMRLSQSLEEYEWDFIGQRTAELYGEIIHDRRS